MSASLHEACLPRSMASVDHIHFRCVPSVIQDEMKCRPYGFKECSPQALVMRWPPPPRLRMTFPVDWTYGDEAS